MTAQVHVRMPLRDGWEDFDASPTVSSAGSSSGLPTLRRRYRRDGRVLAALSIEVLEAEGATPIEFAAAAEAGAPAASGSRPWRRSVVVDSETDPVRVVVHDLDRVTTSEGTPPVLRRTASLTWFLPSDVCLQLRLVADDLLVIGDLGEAVRELGDTVEWEVLE